MKPKDIDQQVDNELQILVDIFWKDIYIGGSFARFLAIPEMNTWNDIDIFIIGGRRQATWCMENLIKQNFKIVENSTEGYDISRYKIPQQEKLLKIVGNWSKVNYDLIFLSYKDIKTLAIEGTASTLSRIYIPIGVDKRSISNSPEDIYKSLPLISKDAVITLLGGQCNIDTKKATQQHLDKIYQLCDIYNIVQHRSDI